MSRTVLITGLFLLIQSITTTTQATNWAHQYSLAVADIEFGLPRAERTQSELPAAMICYTLQQRALRFSVDSPTLSLADIPMTSTHTSAEGNESSEGILQWVLALTCRIAIDQLESLEGTEQKRQAAQLFVYNAFWFIRDLRSARDSWYARQENPEAFKKGQSIPGETLQSFEQKIAQGHGLLSIAKKLLDDESGAVAALPVAPIIDNPIQINEIQGNLRLGRRQ